MRLAPAMSEGEGIDGVFRALQVMQEDLQTVFDRDPAAKNVVELVLAYPGLHAIWLHRLAHKLHRQGVPVLPRLISHLGRFVTGIEIHPGAKIGRRFFVDHGMGVVIGETAEIGDDVLLYQDVTLGIYHAHNARSLRGTKRHPTLRDGVIVGVGAKILGAVTVGEGATIAPGAVVTKDVEPHTTVVGIPARPVVARDPLSGEKRRIDIGRGRVADLADPEIEVIRCLHAKVAELEHRIARMEGGERPAPQPVVNGSAKPRRDEIERALQTSLRALERIDGKD
ncbi:MAG TPA: serine O-acetyltransferase [Tepidisphaeraceae bacterium]|jgi:serine O-acetyltransferase